jgi:hypothetical protein
MKSHYLMSHLKLGMFDSKRKSDLFRSVRSGYPMSDSKRKFDLFRFVRSRYPMSDSMSSMHSDSDYLSLSGLKVLRCSGKYLRMLIHQLSLRLSQWHLKNQKCSCCLWCSYCYYLHYYFQI